MVDLPLFSSRKPARLFSPAKNFFEIQAGKAKVKQGKTGIKMDGKRAAITAL